MLKDQKTRAMLEALKVIQLEVPDCPLSIALTFITCGLWGYREGEHKEPLALSELGEKIGMPFQTTSRHLRYLGDGIYSGEVGPGLVKTEVNIMNRRKKIVYLTPKGHAVFERVAYLLGDRST